MSKPRRTFPPVEDGFLIAASVMSPYPYYNEFYAPWRDTVQQEIQYKGYRIVAVEYTGAFDNSDTMGFNVPAAFVVVDDLDEQALPFSTQWYWSPWDAKNAIDFFLWGKDALKNGRWPTTTMHEFNQMLQYRRRATAVFTAVHDIKKLIRESRDFDDNPADHISKRLQLMELELAAWEPASAK